jgi:hypothetical protein
MGDTGMRTTAPDYDFIEVDDVRKVNKDNTIGGQMVEQKFKRRIQFDTVGRKKEWESFYATPEGKKAVSKFASDSGGFNANSMAFLRGSAKILPADSAWKWGDAKEKQEKKDLDLAKALAPALKSQRSQAPSPTLLGSGANKKQFAGSVDDENGQRLGLSGALRTLLGQ